MTNWKEYTGSDEQIAEINNSKNGYLIAYDDIICDIEHGKIQKEWLVNATHYWIIPGDPLREMKIRWAQTGQPVWIKEQMANEWGNYINKYIYHEPTTTPDWNIPNAEYSFTPFWD